MPDETARPQPDETAAPQSAAATPVPTLVDEAKSVLKWHVELLQSRMVNNREGRFTDADLTEWEQIAHEGMRDRWPLLYALATEA